MLLSHSLSATSANNVADTKVAKESLTPLSTGALCSEQQPAEAKTAAVELSPPSKVLAVAQPSHASIAAGQKAPHASVHAQPQLPAGLYKAQQQQQQQPAKAAAVYHVPAAAAPAPAPAPVGGSASLSNLVNGFYNSLSKRISRRSGKGGALDLYNNIQGAAADYNLGNLNLNDVINSAMLNNAQFASQVQTSGLASQLSTLMKGEKKGLLDLPKQLYKTLGEKITGAGEAAASATVPIKNSFMNTLKSFYSYIKPSRSSQVDAASPLANSGNVDFGSVGSSMLNFKRRTSEIHPFYQQQQQQQQQSNFNNKNGMSLEQFLYNNGAAYNYAKQQADGSMLMEGASHLQPDYLQAQLSHVRGASKSMVPAGGHPNELIKQSPQLEYLRPDIFTNDQLYGLLPQQQLAQPPSQGLYQKSKEFLSKISRRRFGQHKQQQLPAAVAAMPAMNNGYMYSPQQQAQFEGMLQQSQPQQQQSVQQGQQQQQQQQQPGLSSQTIAKVQSKLGGLPSVYNTNQQQQQQQQQPSSLSSDAMLASGSQPQGAWAAKPKRPIASYYTHQPSYHYPGQYIKTKQAQQQGTFPVGQMAGTSSAEVSGGGSSTQPTPVSTSTSMNMSISVHNPNVDEANESVEESADNHGIKDKNDPTLFYYDETPLSHLQNGGAANDDENGSGNPSGVHQESRQNAGGN